VTTHHPYLRIISFDGGGIRGLMTAAWLHQLQSELPLPLGHYADVLVGTSTGSLLACALAAGMTTTDIIRHYQQHGEKIFPRSFARLVGEVERIVADEKIPAEHDISGLRHMLEEIFAEKILQDLDYRCLVGIYDITNTMPLLLDTADACHQSLKVVSACLASCALPTLFPAQPLSARCLAGRLFADGGVFDYNPTAQTIAKLLTQSAEPWDDPQPILVVSFGTGHSKRTATPRSGLAAPIENGDLTWLTEYLSGRLRGVEQRRLEDYLGRCRYYRVQIELPDELMDPTGDRGRNIHKLLSAGHRYLVDEGGGQKIHAIAQALQAASDAS